MEFGKEHGEEAEPLTKQEMEILRSMHASVSLKEASYARWLRGIGNTVPRQPVKFSATLSGEPLKSLRYMVDVLVDGGHFLTKQEMAARIVALGITALHNEMRTNNVGRMMKAVHAITTLPQEMAEKVLTTEIRKDIKLFVDNMSKDNPLPDLTPGVDAEEPDLSQKVVTVAPPAVPVEPPKAPQPVTDTPEEPDGVQSEPAGAPAESENEEEPPCPAHAKCAHCGNRMKTTDRTYFKHAGAKKIGWMHNDCAIDAWQQIREQP